MTTRESVAINAADNGAAYAQDQFRTEIDTETKTNKTDVVTEIDRNTQKKIEATIKEQYPSDSIIGEEGDGHKEVPSEGYAWIIDPIDGTQNYTRGRKEWATSVCVVKDEEPIIAINSAPSLNDYYFSSGSNVEYNGMDMTVSRVKDPEAFVIASTLRVTQNDAERMGRITCEAVRQFGEFRRNGSAQLTLSLVAYGALDAVIGFDPEPNLWDTVAGIHQIRQAGGVVTDIKGNRWTIDSSGIIASNGQAHEQIVDVVETALSES